MILAGSLATTLVSPLAYAASLPAALTNLSLTASGQAAAGQTVTFTATSQGSPAEYQFWTETAQGWKMIQDYSPTRQVSLPLEAGSYIVAVYALSAAAVQSGSFSQALVRTLIVNVNSAVHLTAPATGTQNQEMNIEASATNLITPVYQFWVENPQGQWTSSGGYQPGSGYVYTPPEAGTYRTIVYAKDPDAPNNAQDAVWSQAQTFTVAPAGSAAGPLTAALINPLPALDNPEALLLGQIAEVRTVVTGANGNPIADVPVVFTATNDSNPADHVTFPQGLNGNAVTNAEGIATTTITVTNPDDSTPQALAADPSAVTAVSYQVSVPSAFGTSVGQGQVLFAAVNESGTVVSGSTGPVVTSQRVGTVARSQQYASFQAVSSPGQVPMRASLAAQFIVPQGSASSNITDISQSSGAYGPGSNWQSTPVSIASGFAAATVQVASLGLSSGTTLTMTYTPSDGSEPYTRVLTGPLSASNFGLQIPAQSAGGVLTFALVAPSEVDAQNATGVALQSLTIRSGGAAAVQDVAVPPADVAWTASPVELTAFSPLTATQAQEDLGSQYSAALQYQAAVPVYPEVGDGVVESLSGTTVAGAYWLPSHNNGFGQNVLVGGQKAVAVPPSEALTTPAVSLGSGGTVSAGQAGSVELQATLQIPGVSFALPGLYSYAAFVPASSDAADAPGYALSGQTVMLTAQVRDGNGNLVPAGTPVTWQVSGPGVQVIEQQNQTGPEGTASLVVEGGGSVQALISAFSQGYDTSVSDAGGRGSEIGLQWLPVSLSYTPPGASLITVANGFATAPPLSLTAGRLYQFSVQALAGTLPISNLPFTVSGTGNGTVSASSATSNNQGLITFSGTADTPGSQSVALALNSDLPGTVLIGGLPDVGQGPTSDFAHLTFPLLWQSAGGTESVQWSPVPLALAATGQTAWLTVSVDSPDGNPEPGVPVAFSLSGQQTAVLSASAVTTNAAGLAQVGVSAGTLGESDTVVAQTPGTAQPITANLTWVSPPGPSTLAPVSVELNAGTSPGQLTVNFSRNLNPASVLPDGAQFSVTDMTTHDAYQIESAECQGSQVILTLSPQNPRLPAGDPVAVAVAAVTQDGVTTPITDNYQRPSQAGPVTLFAPSSPTISTELSGGNLVLTLGNGSSGIAAGQSVVVVPSNTAGSVGGLAAGDVYSMVTQAATGTETLSIPYTAEGSVTFSVYFNGIEATVAG